MKIESASIGYKIIGLYQMLCAFWAIYVLTTAFSLLNSLLFIPFIILLLWAGVNLIFLKGKKRYRLTIINQILQIVQFQIGGFGFLYSAGVYLSVGMDALDFNHVFVSFRLWTFTCLLRVNAIEPEFYLAMNIIPVLIILIVLLWKSIKQSQTISLAMKVGMTVSESKK